jgi:hypothetical protein
LTIEDIVANQQQQAILPHLKGSFVSEQVLANPSLATVFNSPIFQQDEKLTPLTVRVFFKQIKVRVKMHITKANSYPIAAIKSITITVLG